MNQCDGCRRRLPIRESYFGLKIHYAIRNQSLALMPKSVEYPTQICTKERYNESLARNTQNTEVKG